MDLRIAMQPLGAPRMGPPVLTTAPVVTPNVPNVMPGAPSMYPSQVAARANAGVGCPPGQVGCGETPSLRDIAPPSFLSKIPRWALWLGGAAGLGLAAWLVVALVRRH
jgi:hypothetical protein